MIWRNLPWFRHIVSSFWAELFLHNKQETIEEVLNTLQTRLQKARDVQNNEEANQIEADIALVEAFEKLEETEEKNPALKWHEHSNIGQSNTKGEYNVFMQNPYFQWTAWLQPWTEVIVPIDRSAQECQRCHNINQEKDPNAYLIKKFTINDILHLIWDKLAALLIWWLFVWWVILLRSRNKERRLKEELAQRIAELEESIAELEELMESSPSPIQSIKFEKYDKNKHKFLERHAIYKELRFVPIIHKVNQKTLSMFWFEDPNEMIWVDMLNPKFIDDENLKILLDAMKNPNNWSAQCQIDLILKWNPSPVSVDIDIKYWPDRSPLRAFSTIQDATALKEAEKNATTDPLTWLWNRQKLSTILDREYKNSKRCEQEQRKSQQSFSVLILDIDYFKSINDWLWHSEWDNTLRNLADLLRKNIRDSDEICRYWWEEFVVVMPDTDTDWAMIVAEKIRKAVENELKTTRARKIPQTNANTNKITVSIWVTEYHCNDDVDSDWVYSIVKRADKALYQSKNQWRNRATLAEAA